MSMSNSLENIRSNLENGLRDLESYAQSHANDDISISIYEQRLIEKLNALKNSVSKELDRFEQDLAYYRSQSCNGIAARKNYAELLQHATISFNKMTYNITETFKKMGNVIKEICRKIVEEMPNIIDIIASLFRSFIFPIISIKNNDSNENKLDQSRYT